MATDCSQESVLQFLLERGGRVKNVDLVEHFKFAFLVDPSKRAAAKETFKGYVDNVAVVKTENGVKYVCLKKKYGGSAKCAVETADGECNGQNYSNRSRGITLTGYNALDHQLVQPAASRKTSPGTDYSTSKGKAVRSLSASSAEILPPKFTGKATPPNAVGTNYLEGRLLGNGLTGSNREAVKRSEIECNALERCLSPVASPMDAGETGPNFNTSVQLKYPRDREPSQGDVFLHSESAFQNQRDEVLCDRRPPMDVGNRGFSKGGPLGQPVSRRRTSRGSQRSLLFSDPSEDAVDEGHVDSTSVSGSDSSTPGASRKNVQELVANSSPQARHSKLHRYPGHHLVRYRERDSVRSESDSASVVSSIDDDSGIVTLDPLEHEWMMCASDGQWESLHRLLQCEPNLVVKKDFVTGFTCLHWAAKQGKQELLALLVNFAKQHSVPLNINARSSAGYTPLHLAAMHNHIEVVKLLVGAYDANVDVRDYSGKKASQYLSSTVSDGIRDIIGAAVHTDGESTETGSGRWRFSKVLHTNFKLHNHPEEDVVDGAVKYKPLYRKSSLNRMKPRLQKMRFKTQIVHSTSFREAEEGEVFTTSPVNSRPKSSLFS